MKKIFILILFVIHCSTFFAQTSVTGIVSDTNGIFLTGASVYIPDLNKGTVCDINGKYVIENLPAGKITVRFSFVGYNTLAKTILTVKGENVLNIKLSEAVIQSQEVVITGGTVSSQHDNAVKIEILKSKDILISGSPNFMEVITQIPGVEMIAKGQGVSKPVIRGLSMNNILVLNNGVRIENYQFSENHPLGIDDNNLDRIEVIKGPASMLYGSDAIGGVINFIKEESASTGTITGDFQTRLHSNSKGIINSIGVKGALEHLSAGIRINSKTHSDYKQGGGEFVPNSRFNEWSLSANTGYTGKKGRYKVYYDYFKQDLGMTVPPVKFLITEPGRKNNIWYQDLEHHLISSQNKLFIRNIKWETNVAYQSALRKLQTTLNVPLVEMNLNTITYESKLHLPSNLNSEYIVGIQGMNQLNRNQNDRASQFLPDADVNNIGLLTFLQYTIIRTLKIQGGLRFDSYNTKTYALGTEGTEKYIAPVSKNFSSFNGSVGATYSIKEKVMFRINFAKAFRVPNLSELTSNGEHGNRYEIGNTGLNPENAYEEDASIHYHGEYLSFDMAGFYNNIDNYIYASPTDDTTTNGMNIYRFSQTNAFLFGGEAGVHFHPKTMAWLHIKGVYSTVTGKQEDGNYLPFIPAQKFRYELRVEKEEISFLSHPSICFSLLSALQKNNPSVFETKTEGYTLLNFCFKTEFKVYKQNITFGFTINNIFDQQYSDHLSTLKEMNYYNQGRNFCISLKIPFVAQILLTGKNNLL